MYMFNIFLAEIKKNIILIKHYLDNIIINLTTLTKILKFYVKIIETEIINECIHEKVDDYIDISPEHSQKITYCIKCETTF